MHFLSRLLVPLDMSSLKTLQSCISIKWKALICTLLIVLVYLAQAVIRGFVLQRIQALLYILNLNKTFNIVFLARFVLEPVPVIREEIREKIKAHEDKIKTIEVRCQSAFVLGLSEIRRKHKGAVKMHMTALCHVYTRHIYLR